jgi:hypothetical protein
MRRIAYVGRGGGGFKEGEGRVLLQRTKRDRVRDWRLGIGAKSCAGGGR